MGNTRRRNTYPASMIRASATTHPSGEQKDRIQIDGGYLVGQLHQQARKIGH